MKKTHKQIAGLVSLGAVAGMTLFAATLPSPGASAATIGITDQLTVRVIGTVPDVSIVKPLDNVTVVAPGQLLEFNYENVYKVRVAMRYKSLSGEITDVDNFLEIDANYQPGTFSKRFDLTNYGSGTFTFTIYGTGADDVIDTDAIEITFLPISSEIEENKDDGSVDVKIDYFEEAEPEKVEVVVYGPDGKPVYTKTAVPPVREVNIPFDDIDGLPDGDYTISITGYGDGGEVVYTKDYTYRYETTPIPNTGSFLKDLNVSKEDFLITGLIMFFAISAVGVGVIVKKKR